MSGQPVIDHNVISMDEIHHTVILLQDFLKKGNWLLLHGFLEQGIELRIGCLIHGEKIK